MRYGLIVNMGYDYGVGFKTFSTLEEAQERMRNQYNTTVKDMELEEIDDLCDQDLGTAYIEDMFAVTKPWCGEEDTWHIVEIADED